MYRVFSSEKAAFGRTAKVLLSFLLAIFLAGTAAVPVWAADEPSETTPNSVVDGDTSRSFLNSLADDGNTRYDGRVWTDKTVLNSGAAIFKSDGTPLVGADGQQVVIDKGDSEFLVEYSALATSTAVRNTRYTPVDVVFVVDLSASMYTGGASEMDDGDTRLANLVESLNTSVNSLLEMNEGNRVGVVGYRSADTADVLLPFGSYEGSVEFELINSSSDTPTIDVKNVTEDMVEKSISTTQLSNSVDIGTNVQAGVAAGMDMLLNTEETTYTYNSGTSSEQTVKRVPSLVLMADGWATHSSPSETWWSNDNHSLEESQGLGLGVYYGHAMKAMMTAATMKQQVDVHYDIDENSEYPMRVYTLGFGLDAYSGSEKELAQAMLDPGSSVYDGTSNAEGQKIYDAFQSYIGQDNTGTPAINTGVRFRVFGVPDSDDDGQPDAEDSWKQGTYNSMEPTYYGVDGAALFAKLKNSNMLPQLVQYDDPTANDQKLAAWVMFDYNGYTLNHPGATVPDVTSLDYSDGYYAANSATDAASAFEEIVDVITTSRPQAPTETGEDDPEVSGYITYTDPIGEYMQVDDVKAILFANTLFTAKDVVVDDQNGTKTYTFTGSVSSPVYGSHSLGELKIVVTTVGDGIYAKDTLTIAIPATLIPLRTNTITYDQDGTTIVSNETNGSMPLRVFYGVGLRDGVLDENGIVKVDDPDTADIAEGIDSDYVDTNTDANGIKFFSNLFSGKTEKDAEGQDVTVGDATVTYTPDQNNPFYYFQQDIQLYADKDCTQELSSGQLIDDQAYYFIINYVDGTGAGTAVIERKGSLLRDYVNDSGKIKAGSPRLGNLLELVDISKPDGDPSDTGAHNGTNTATAYYYPEFGEDGTSITVYQGNNGVVSYPAPEPPIQPGLEVVKQAESESGLGEALAGAQFALYKDTDKDGIWDSTETGEGTPIATGTSGQDGTVSFEPALSDLEFGVAYFLQETEAPDEYQLMGGYVSIVFSENDGSDQEHLAETYPVKAQITYPGGESSTLYCNEVSDGVTVGTVRVVVMDKPLPGLPTTGGSMAVVLMGAGVGVMLLAAYALRRNASRAR